MKKSTLLGIVGLGFSTLSFAQTTEEKALLVNQETGKTTEMIITTPEVNIIPGEAVTIDLSGIVRNSRGIEVGKVVQIDQQKLDSILNLIR